MQYYDVGKVFSDQSDHNDYLIQKYIHSHGEGHRVFQGNFTSFPMIKKLMMLGCNVSYKVFDDGSFSPMINHMHIYENDAPDMFALIDSLE